MNMPYKVSHHKGQNNLDLLMDKERPMSYEEFKKKHLGLDDKELSLLWAIIEKRRR